MKREKARRGTRKTTLFAAACAVAATVFSFAPVNADTPQPALALHALDASQQGEVTAYFMWSGDPSQAQNAEVTVNGAPADARVQQRARDSLSVGFLVDVSRDAERSGTLDVAKAWLTGYLGQRPQGDRDAQPVAIYAVGAEPTRVLGYTTDLSAQLDAVQKLNPQVGTTASDPDNENVSLWGTVELAADNLSGANFQQENIVFVGASGQISSGGYASAVSQMKRSGAIFYSAVAPGGTSGDIDAMSATTGGVSVSTGERDQLRGRLDELMGIVEGAQYAAEIDLGDSSPTTLTVGVTVNGREIVGVVAAGTTARGLSSLPIAAPVEGAGGLLSNPILLVVGLVLFAGAAALIAYVLLGETMERKSFSSQVATYTQYGEAGKPGPLTEEEQKNATKSVLIQRAIEATEKLAERRNLTTRVQIALERADVALRPAEFLFLYLLFIPLAALVGLYVNGPLFFLLFGLVAAIGPPALLANLAERRRKKFVTQLPDLLHLVAGSLRAGYSLPQGLEAAAEEAGNPIAQELRRATSETRLGADPIEALDRIALRMNSQDFSWAVMGISIQREVGGDLAELLDTISETMTQRERLRREILTLTAEGRISALILVLLPVALFILLYVLNPSYVAILFTTNIGRLLLLVGALGLTAGWFIMKKIVAIKI